MKLEIPKIAIQKWRESLARLGWDRRMLLSAALLSAIPALATVFMQKEEIAKVTESRPLEVDTMIPLGFVLVPIDVQNYEALDSILGRFGVVDLFQTGPDASQTQSLVARNVRILRAPQNPTHFAILIREEEVANVLRQGGVFTVIVKRPGKDGTEFVNTMKPKRRKIVYEGG